MLKSPMGELASERMPVLFVGHGSPMNAINTNAYTQWLNDLGRKIRRPRAVLVISAHWTTDGVWITEMPNPKTIHDFYGFPPELYDVRYPAPGAPEIAKMIRETFDTPQIHSDFEVWGLDHGAWSVLCHLFPNADVPVLQLSLNLKEPAEYHFEFGRKLSIFRDNGILILASGNLVHNLKNIRWTPNAKPYDWAVEFDEWIKRKLLARNYAALLNDYHKSEAGRFSVPSMEHYLPLHYVLGASDTSDNLTFEFSEIQNGSISMRSFSFGP